MKINKLTKDELREGLTLDMVNRINMHKGYSPVQLLPGDEPTQILKCEAGYWVKNPDGPGYLKNEKGQLLVFGERECQIGRARYLLHFGFEEKQVKVEKLIISWLDEVRKQLDQIKLKLEVMEKGHEGVSGHLWHAVKEMNPEGWAKQQAKDEKEYNRLKPQYEELEAMYERKEFVGLLGILEIKKFENPMMVARYDHLNEMQVLSNVFGKTSIDNWDGDTLAMYARLEVEKEYAGI